MRFQTHFRFAWFALGFLVLASCGLLEERQDGILLAKAYDSRLYLNDLDNVFFPGVKPQDSLAILQRQVDRWVRQQVMVHHALASLSADEMDFEHLVEEYRKSLIIFAYERKIAKHLLDSVVSRAEIEAFYENNKQHLSLKSNVVLANYVKLPLNAPDLRTVRSLYRSGNEQDLRRLEDYCLENAASYYLGLDQWMVLDDILIDMPLEITSQAQFLHNNRFVETNDDYYRYFLYINDYRLRGDVPPLNIEEENIRTLIMSNRKKEFLANKRRELYNQSIDDNKVEKFF